LSLQADDVKKCDEAKPICGRCSRSKIECKYRDQDDLLFRNQTASAAQRAEESWRKRSKSRIRVHGDGSSGDNTILDNEIPSSANIPSHSVSAFHRDASISTMDREEDERGTSANELSPISDIENLTINPPIGHDLRQLAYERFIYDFVTPDNDERPLGEPTDSLYVFVPLLYQSTAPNSCFATVVQAVSYINFANRCHSPQAAARAEECFGKGITMLSKMISDKEQVVSDETLCSSYLMGVYEVC